jgi:glyoxylate reductase
MSARIVVTNTLPDAAVALLEAVGDVWIAPEPLTADALRVAAGGADALVTFLHDRVDAALLEAAGPGLRCVANVAVGHDNIDLDAARARAVVVTNTPAVLTDATADLAMALLLAVTRRIGEGERLLRAQTPWSWRIDFLLGHGLQGRTLGIVGLGAIGQATAARARAFGMDIAYAGRRAAPAAVERALGARRLDFDTLVATVDVLSLHCPLTPQTRHLLDAQRLASMREGSYLINTARGPIVDEAALAHALRAGPLAGAGLDVFEAEPAVHPDLLACENAVLAPHLGSATVETRTAMAVLAARNVVAVLEGRTPPTAVADTGAKAPR